MRIRIFLVSLITIGIVLLSGFQHQVQVIISPASTAGAPTFFQSAVGCAVATTTCNGTLGSALTAGHRLLVMELSNGTNSTPTMTGETFTPFTGTTGCGNNTGDTLTCYLVTSAVGGQTVTTCTTTGSALGCIMMDITAPQGLSPKDAGGNSQVASGTSYTVSTSATTTNANDLIVACMGSIAQSGTYTAGSPYTQVTGSPQGTGTLHMFCESNAPGSTGTQTATGTVGTSARNVSGIIAIQP